MTDARFLSNNSVTYEANHVKCNTLMHADKLRIDWRSVSLSNSPQMTCSTCFSKEVFWGFLMNEFHELFIHHTTDVIIQRVAYCRVVFDYCIMNWFKNDFYFLRNITHQTHYIISLTNKKLSWCWQRTRRVCRSVEVNKHFGSIPSKIIKNNSE